jgi:DtxR family transcriptional regulator, Mn-dependent transcriptional regulator
MSEHHNHSHGQGEEGITPVVSEYLQGIYNLEMEGEPAHAAALARKFGKSRANVSALLERMRKLGLVGGAARGDVELTTEGRKQAEMALRRHRLAERYLVDALGLDWITAHEEAHHFEQAITPVLEEAILAKLGNVTTCPHGNPIPGQVKDAAEYLRDLGGVRLVDAPVGRQLEVICVTEVVEDETATLRYVGEKGLRPGRRFSIEERSPDGEALQLQVDGGRTASVSKSLASLIWVRAA